MSEKEEVKGKSEREKVKGRKARVGSNLGVCAFYPPPKWRIANC
jgi:hypothetical protein